MPFPSCMLAQLNTLAWPSVFILWPDVRFARITRSKIGQVLLVLYFSALHSNNFSSLPLDTSLLSDGKQSIKDRTRLDAINFCALSFKLILTPRSHSLSPMKFFSEFSIANALTTFYGSKFLEKIQMENFAHYGFNSIFCCHIRPIRISQQSTTQYTKIAVRPDHSPSNACARRWNGWLNSHYLFLLRASLDCCSRVVQQPLQAKTSTK